MEAWPHLRLKTAAPPGGIVTAEGPQAAALPHGRLVPMPATTAAWVGAGGIMLLHAHALRDMRALLAAEAAAGLLQVGRSVDFGMQKVVVVPDGHAAGGEEAGADAQEEQDERSELLQVVCDDSSRRRLRFRSLRLLNTSRQAMHIINVTAVSSWYRCNAVVCPLGRSPHPPDSSPCNIKPRALAHLTLLHSILHTFRSPPTASWGLLMITTSAAPPQPFSSTCDSNQLAAPSRQRAREARTRPPPALPAPAATGSAAVLCRDPAR